MRNKPTNGQIGDKSLISPILTELLVIRSCNFTLLSYLLRKAIGLKKGIVYCEFPNPP